MRYLLWLLLLIVVVIRFVSSRPSYQSGQYLRITAKITSEPIQYTKSQQIRLDGLSVSVPSYPRIHYGDTVVVTGKVEGNKLKNPILVRVIETKSPLFNFREQLIEFYLRALPEPHASLVAGMSIGSKSEMPSAFWEKLKNSGTAHIVVASGMNITLVAGFLLSLCIHFLPRRKAIFIALAGVWIYALIAGFDAPIIRAALMGSLALTAQRLGRMNDSWNTMIISALLMLIIWPMWVLDLGFWLSFTATASLMKFSRSLMRLLHKVPPVIRENLATTLAAQIGVTPLLLVAFGRFNLFSPLINTLVLWTVVPVTVIGMVAGMIGTLVEPLGRLVLYLAYPLTWWFIAVINLFGG